MSNRFTNNVTPLDAVTLNQFEDDLKQYMKDLLLITVSLSPAGNQSFTQENLGYAQVPAKTITVSNIGNQTTGNLTVALSGSNPSDFVLNTTTVSSIAAGSFGSFTVRPQDGLISGDYQATVTVSGANITPASFDVSFTVLTRQVLFDRTVDGNTLYLPIEADYFSSWGQDHINQFNSNLIGYLCNKLHVDDVRERRLNIEYYIAPDYSALIEQASYVQTIYGNEWTMLTQGGTVWGTETVIPGGVFYWRWAMFFDEESFGGSFCEAETYEYEYDNQNGSAHMVINKIWIEE